MTDALGNNPTVFGAHSLPLLGQAAPWWGHCSLLMAAQWPSAGLPVPAQSLLLLVPWLTNAGLVSLSIKKYPVPAPSQGPSLPRTSHRSFPPPFMHLAFPGMLVQSQGESRLPLPGCAQGCAHEHPRERACPEAGLLSVPDSSVALEATCPPKREPFFSTAFLEGLWPKPDQSGSFPEAFPPVLRKTGRLSAPSSLWPGARGGVPKESHAATGAEGEGGGAPSAVPCL